MVPYFQEQTMTQTEIEVSALVNTIVDSLAQLNDTKALRHLNKQVVARLNHLDRQEQAVAALAFNIGQRVKFESKKRGVISGVITKVNQKTVNVKTETLTWRVSPSLLTVVENKVVRGLEDLADVVPTRQTKKKDRKVITDTPPPSTIPMIG